MGSSVKGAGKWETLKALIASGGAALVGFLQGGVGAIVRTVQLKLQESVSVMDFGAVGDGVADDSAAFNAAIATGRKVCVPAGTFKCNVTVSSRIILAGEGSTKTIIKPFNPVIAAITFKQVTPYWTEHSEISSVGFEGAAQVGIGVTMGQSVPANFVAGDQYAQGLTFRGCRFYNLEKGFQSPFGNIGIYFYSCAFLSNKYGCYFLDNKFGGDIMHAGCKYFYGGNFTGNICAFYCHNVTDGFGAVQFNGTIFEANNVVAYVYAASTFVPIAFNGCWAEANGNTSGSPVAPTVTIDLWTGAVRSDQILNKRTFIFDGQASTYKFNSSFFTDAYLKATGSTIVVTDCRVEEKYGYSGFPSAVVDASSAITIINPYTGGGLPQSGDFIVSDGVVTPRNLVIDGNSSSAATRPFTTSHRNAKSFGYGGNKAVSLDMLSLAAVAGIAPTVSLVSDGIIYPTCNHFTRALFKSNEFGYLPDSVFTTAAGYYVFSIDIKTLAGAPTFFWWNASTIQFANGFTPPALNRWYTFAGIGYSPGGQTIYLGFNGSNGVTGELCTWRKSAVQMMRFDTLEEAQSFLASRVFAAPASSAFTPKIGGTIGGGVTTYTTQTGNYQVVGNVCYYSITLAWTATTAAGSLQISGLPVAGKSGANIGHCGVNYYIFAAGAGKELTGEIDSAAATISLYASDQAGGALAGIAPPATGTLKLAGWYLVA